MITKALSKEGTEYTSKQAHAELARRMKERDPNTAPAIGDRVPYVIIKSNKGIYSAAVTTCHLTLFL